MSLVKWKSPERRIAENVLLPNELFLDIIEHFVPHPRGFSEAECQSTLNRLAFVCRFFFVECTRRTFSKIILAGSKSMTRRGHGEWIKQVLDNNPLAKSFEQHVQECVFKMWNPPTPAQAWVYSAHLKQRAQVVSGFENLSTLHMEYTPVTQSFFMAVVAKDTLHTVTINNCNLVPPESPWNIHALRTRWSSVRVMSCYGAIAAYAEPLAELSASAELEKCVVNDRVIAYAIISKPIVFSRLREIYVPNTSGVEQLLERTPSITKLCLSGVNAHNVVALSPQCLPQLQDLSCSMDNMLLPCLMTKRRLQKLLLLNSGVAGIETGWQALKRAVGLKSLDIPAPLYSSHPISDICPRLDQLRLSWPIGDSSTEPSPITVAGIDSICDLTSKSRHSEVGLLAFTSHLQWFDVGAQHQAIITSISRAFPRTKIIQFSDCFEWRLQGSKWRVEVIDRHFVKQEILFRIKKSRLGGVEDFDGVLAGLFDNQELEGSPALRSILDLV